MITRTRASQVLLTCGLGRLRIASLAESQRSMPYEHGRLPRRTDHDTLSRSAEPPSAAPLSPILPSAHSRRVSRLERHGSTSCAETARDCRLRAMPLVLAAESEWP
jgi:hypothetical protein